MLDKVDSITTGGKGRPDLISSLGIGLGTATVIMLAGFLTGLEGIPALVASIGAAWLGLGVAAWVMARRLAKRIPEHVGASLQLAGSVASQSAGELDRLGASAEQLVRGLVMVGAVPVVAAAVSRRFVLLRGVARPLVEGVVARVVDRLVPVIVAPVDGLAPRVGAVIERLSKRTGEVDRKVTSLTRWGVLPLRVAGVVAAGAGSLMVLGGWIAG